MELSSQYYEESGAAPPLGVLLGSVTGIVAGVVLAFIYAYLLVYNPFIYISVIATAGFGGLVGLAVGIGMRMGKVRSSVVNVVGSIGFVGIAYYVSWAVWVYASVSRADIDVALAPLLNPLVLGQGILAINKDGAWSVFSWTPTGISLWLFWLAEAAIIFGVGLLAGLGGGSGTFCERCNDWCEEHEAVARAGAGTLGPSMEEEHATIAQRLDARDWAALERLGPVKDSDNYYRIDLASCHSCDQLHALTVEHVTATYDKDGDRSEDTTTVVDRLLVSAQEAARVSGDAT